MCQSPHDSGSHLFPGLHLVLRERGFVLWGFGGVLFWGGGLLLFLGGLFLFRFLGFVYLGFCLFFTYDTDLHDFLKAYKTCSSQI